ncbi:DUF58 domain-containing protein [Tuwongella immobilis]|uniref:DUF58 domain-containing protein n=1 Tax=Tuwongella immobilis TaxID=692036 RepID=A0A6C2YR49_9BACT|nr:DUF58 domain-containing protein [Tuwongella immobilis]VIP03352.1 Conserved repeat protein OS=Singulisphaera acidiphila (strain ATCC BAA-1392 / DSM 18658 / VKM B-2454 / MOB10) GN=Sinac_2139 PE=4 SV=1: DUF58 [Tuwongella immobilis]VTS04076.1 Conserved repeat protein OS=Singulisphaera acidiphila (strain ATCC BAA-1392 / DSM 18658 / VKM B-2454 / MOB10) GN=Sinac_2139 PE=4 SV=1: DUF58 [Tuwongella immobilis]
MRWFLGIGALLLIATVLEAGLIVYASYTLFAIAIGSRYLAREWVRSLEIEREPIESPIEVGQSIEVKIRLHNRGRWPIAWVLVEDLLPTLALRQRPTRLSMKGKRLRIAMIRAGKSITIKYRLHGEMRGFYQIGPLVAETGDLFGLHRRHRLLGRPQYLQVNPPIRPLPNYDFASERPVGEVQLAHWLFEDPTRTAGVRPYRLGDPLQRVHWRATARTGSLHSRIYEPTTLAGATLLLDFHADGYHQRGEPYRSELAVIVTVALANAVQELGQQVGLVSNGRDAADRLRQEQAPSPVDGEATRDSVRQNVQMDEANDRLRPVHVETRRGIEVFANIRDYLARLELADSLALPQLVMEMLPRMPRDATVLAVLPQVPVESAVALGLIRRQGFAVSVILIGLSEDERAVAQGRLISEGVRDVRSINRESELALLGKNLLEPGENPYGIETALI